MKVNREYRDVAIVIARYWKGYGGATALWRSPYAHISFVLALVMARRWMAPNWWNDVLDVTPSLLGFTVGGYALLAGFGTDRFRRLISGQRKPGETSPLLAINAMFIHFILLQLTAVIWALLSKYLHFPARDVPLVGTILANLFESWTGVICAIRIASWLFGFWLFVYAIMSTAAIALAIFRLSQWYDQYATDTPLDEQ